jgi:predicted RNase H-like HicB family nuclease
MRWAPLSWRGMVSRSHINGLVMKASKRFVIEMEQEADGRWIAEIPALPGVLAYGATREEAIAKAKALALRVLAERLEHGEPAGELEGLFEAA